MTWGRADFGVWLTYEGVMAPGFVSAFGVKLKCVDGFVGKY